MDWNSSALWGIIGLLGGIVSGYIFFYLGNKTKKLIYDINSRPLITDKVASINGLDIKFNGNPIPSLISTELVLQNAGSDIIEPQDFAKVDPLSISVNKGVFLFRNNINEFKTKTSETSDTNLNLINDSNALIDFDFIKKGEILGFTIIHTGNIVRNGTLKKGKIIESSVFRKRESVLYKAMYISLMLVLVILMRGPNSISMLLSNLAIGFILINYASNIIHFGSATHNRDQYTFSSVSGDVNIHSFSNETTEKGEISDN